MTVVMADDVLTIAQDMFTAMIDGEPGHLGPAARSVTPAAPVHAWVEITGESPVRVLTTLGRGTAELITRALLGLARDETVGTDDVGDALGEVANVVGGNVKGLLPQPGPLTLPVVTFDRAAPAGGRLLWERALQWHEEQLTISMWTLEATPGKEQRP